MLFADHVIVDDRNHEGAMWRDFKHINLVLVTSLYLLFHLVICELGHLALDASHNPSTEYIPNEDVRWQSIIQVCLVNIDEAWFV